MYFADVSVTNNLSIYKGLLDFYLEHPESDETRRLFETIIKTAHQLSINAISENQIDHTFYGLVTELVDFENKYNRRYFQDINPNEIGDNQFRSLSNILGSLAPNNYDLV